MSIRCAMCGSKNVYVDSKKEGYNLKAGVVGTALVGVPGALAGTVGNDTKYYHCRECGQTLNKPMMSIESDWIDGWLVNPKMYHDELKRMKTKYKNIEWGDNVSSAGNKICVRPEFANLSPLGRWVNSIYAEMQQRNLTLILEEQLISMIDEDDDVPVSTILRHMELDGKIVRERIQYSNWVRLVTDIDEMKTQSVLASEKYEKQRKREEENRDAQAKSMMPYFMTIFTKNPEKKFSFDDVEGEMWDVCDENKQPYVKRTVLHKILRYLVDDGLIVFYKGGYCLPETVQKLEEKRIREEEELKRRKEEIDKKNEEIRVENELIEKNNKEIRAKIDELEKERNLVNITISENKNKLFGAGAKARKEAQARLEEINREIADLRPQIKFLKKYLSL